MADDKPKPLLTRFFHGCLLLLGGIVALSLALDVLSRFWGWVALVAAIVALIWAAVWFFRWQRDGRW